MVLIRERRSVVFAVRSDLKVLFFVFSILGSSEIFGQDRFLHGRIINEEKLPVWNAKVYLPGISLTMRSDSTGSFAFSNLTPGHHLLVVEALGYWSDSLVVNVGNERNFLQIVLFRAINSLNEVTIKGSRQVGRQQAHALNVEIVKSDDILRTLGGSLMQTLGRLPGVKSIGIGSGQSKPLIRGMGFNRVIVLDNGIKHEGQQWGADHGLEIDQFAADEVEIIKGAASFAYGSDAIGGAVAINSKPIPLPNSLRGTLDVVAKTNNSLYGASINLSGRKTHWFADTRITHQHYADYRVPADTVHVYSYAVSLPGRRLRNTAGREYAFHFRTGYLNKHFQSTVSLSNLYSKSGFFANAHGLEPRRVDTQIHDQYQRDIQMPRQQVNHFKMLSRTRYSFFSHFLELDLGYQINFRQEFSPYISHGYMPPVYPENMPAGSNLERQFRKVVYSANLKSQYSVGSHLLSVGFNADHQDNQIGGWSFLTPGFRQTTAGMFLYDYLRVNHRLTLHAAMRVDRSIMKTFQYRDWFATPLLHGQQTDVSQHLTRADQLRRQFNSFVWLVGMSFNPDQFFIKANLGKSFRIPIAKELAANGVNYHYFSYELGNASLSAEKSYQTDLLIGWKDDRCSVQLSPFYNYFPNYIYLNPTPDHDYSYGAGNQIFRYTENKVSRIGGEIKFSYQVWKALSTEVTGEYLYTRQMSGEKKGYTVPFSPPASFLVNLTYHPFVHERIKNSYLSVDLTMTARQHRIVPPEQKTPGYSLIHIRAGTTFNAFSLPFHLRLQMQNLGNVKYLNHTSFYRQIQLPEAGRNLIVSLSIPLNFTTKP